MEESEFEFHTLCNSSYWALRDESRVSLAAEMVFRHVSNDIKLDEQDVGSDHRDFHTLHRGGELRK